MRGLLAALGLGCLLFAGGCGCSRAEAKNEAKKPAKLDYSGWPKDTLSQPSEAAMVDKTALREVGDSEPNRLASQFQVPDWAESTSPIAFEGPKGARIEFHYLLRGDQLRKQDDATLQGLLKGKDMGARKLVVARPWRGWFGEAGTAHAKGLKSIPYRMRVYSLFQPTRYLEIDLEWPTGNKEAFDEAQSLVASVIYSVSDMAEAAKSSSP